jgi:trimeric autotransporter adhesin
MSTKIGLLSAVFILAFFRPCGLIAQVAVNTDGSLPDSKSILDIKSANKGVLLPRIALTGTTDNTTIPSPPESMLIYNTAAVSDVTPGYYYWNGSKWTTISSTVTTPGGWNTSIQYNNSGTFGGNLDLVWDLESGRLTVKSLGSMNLFLGENSGNPTLTGNSNMFIGSGTGSSITSGYSNTFVGPLTGQYVSSSWGNTFLGRGIGLNAGASTGNWNTIIGADAASNGAFTGRDNSITGATGGRDLSSGVENALSGSSSGYQLQSGSRNSFQGFKTGGSDVTGNNNIYFGYQAGDNATGSNNVILGYDIDVPVSVSNYQLSIGNLLYGTGVDGTGTTLSGGKIGVGLTVPASLFHSAGQIRSGIPLGGLGGAPATTGSVLFYNSSNSNSVTLRTGITSSSYALTMPTSPGSTSTFVKNDGSGNLGWMPGMYGSSSANYATYWSDATTLAGEQYLDATRGGTGMGSYTTGDVIYASGTNTLSHLADVATGNAFISGGVGVAPSWGKIDLTNHVNGILPVASGGSNTNATPTSGALAYGTGSAFAFTAAGTNGQVLTSGGAGAPTWTNASPSGTGTANYASYWIDPTTLGAEQYLNVSRGGTGLGSYTRGDFIYASSPGTLSKLPDVATGNAIISGGVEVAPVWGKIGLTSHVTGVLPIANGGTNGNTTPAAGTIAYGNGSAFAFTASGTSGQVLTSSGSGNPVWSAASVTGSGTANYAAYWSNTTTLAPEQYLNVTRGGTGMGSYITGGLLFSYNGNQLSTLSDVAPGSVLLAGGEGIRPAWGKIDLTTHITGVLPIANGGTNTTATPTAGGIAYGTGSEYACTAAGTTGQVLTSNGSGAPTWSGFSYGLAWKIYGNALDGLTNPFLGTTDTKSVKFKVNNLQAGLLDVNMSNTSFGLEASKSLVIDVVQMKAVWNTALGRSALMKATTPWYNTAIGYQALMSSTTSEYNVAIGAGALRTQTWTNWGTTWEGANVAIGYNALYSTEQTADITVGINNTAVGYQALYYNVTGRYNTAIGYNAGTGTATNLNNTTAIGNGATVSSSNQVMIGNSDVTWIGGQVSWTARSDARWKKDIVNIPFGLDFIEKLRPVEYTLAKGNGRMDWGFLAQDIESVIGTGNNVLSVGEDKDRTLGLRYTDFLAPMVRAMQEQNAVIERQKTEIASLDKQKEEIIRMKEALMKRIMALEQKK